MPDAAHQGPATCCLWEGGHWGSGWEGYFAWLFEIKGSTLWAWGQQSSNQLPAELLLLVPCSLVGIPGHGDSSESYKTSGLPAQPSAFWTKLFGGRALAFILAKVSRKCSDWQMSSSLCGITQPYGPLTQLTLQLSALQVSDKNKNGREQPKTDSNNGGNEQRTKKKRYFSEH